MNDRVENDSSDKNDSPGRSLSPDERVRLRKFMELIDTPEKLAILEEIMESYAHSRWVVVASMKLAKYGVGISAAILAYKQLPGLLK
jgi:hypothetical protein